MPMKQILQAVLVLGIFSMSSAPLAREIDYQRALAGVARDIARLKRDYPQMAEFSIAQHVQAKELEISYGFHTHQAMQTGGWTSGVPNPDADGIWFYIDFHNPDSTLQIHTQPVTAPICIGSKRVSFLMLEGSRTKSVRAPMHKILRKHGAKDCERSRNR